jgi:flagellar basal-body rod modification protein FlgD
MQIHALSQSSDNKTASASQSSGMSDIFLQLLTAQLKSQGPFDPLDPNQFVNELAQFNTLNEVMEIRQLLEQVAAAAIPPASDSATKGGQ